MKLSLPTIVFILHTIFRTICIGHTVVRDDSLFDESKRTSPQFLAEAIVHHIGIKPTAIIMDQKQIGTMRRYWDTLKLSNRIGATLFIYHHFLEDSTHIRVKPNASRALYRFIANEWAIVCFLDGDHNAAHDHGDMFLTKYLKQIRYVAHARADFFIFLGAPDFIHPILENPLIRKFRNVFGISLDGNSSSNLSASAYHRKTCQYDEQSQFHLTKDLYLPTWVKRRQNCLSGHHFRISATDFPPFMFPIRPEDSDNGQLQIHGTFYHALEAGSDHFNYTIEVLNGGNPNKWTLMGRKGWDGSWDGIFGDLVYDKSEIASVSNPTAERNGLADFIGPFGKSNLVYMSAEPLSYARFEEYWVLHPFRLPVWVVLIVALFLTFIINAGALHLEYLFKERAKYRNYTILESFKKAFTMVTAYTFEQEIGKPKGFILRFVMISWVAFMIIVATAFRCNLAAFILRPETDPVPKTFLELYDQKDYKIIFDLGGAGFNEFETVKDPRLRSLLNRTETTEDTSNCTLEAFLNIETVCAGWDFSLRFAASKNLTYSLDEEGSPMYTSESLFETWFVIATENNSVFTKEFSRFGNSLYETGVFSYWEDAITLREKYRGQKWLAERKDTEVYSMLTAFSQKRSQVGQEKLKRKNLEFPFILLFVGFGLASVAFLGELLKGSDIIQRMINRRGNKIRKISVIVKRKISKSSMTDPQDRVPVIQVTFIP